MLLKILFFPFYLVWSLVGFLFNLMGRLISGVVGCVLLIVGIILTVTVVGAVVGVPFIILGFSLCTKAIFR
ncbi:hypothetical protein LJC63_01865 [Ruminococcaceae bacterium OttesenSCG-928-L11]|nr:hypothetical protein [Ruminococcaceae bacterium OttesenSCG-928-L11]